MKNPEQKTPQSSASYPSSTFEDFLDRSGLGDVGLTPEEIRREIATNPVTKAIVEAFAETEAKTIEQGRDPLTGCLNLNGLEEFLDRRDKQFGQRADHTRLTDIPPKATLVVLMDGDGVKRINDTYGHADGDKTIVALADRLRDSVRADDVVVRLGGDEFLVIADIYSDSPDAARIIVKKIEESTSDVEVSSDNGSINVSASVGFEYLQGFQGKSAIEAARKRADKAMYEKKEAKKLASAGS